MEAEALLDKFAQDEGFGNFETVILNCHRSVIRSVAIAALNQALHQPLISGKNEQFKCGKCSSNWGELRAICFNCGHESEDLST